MNARIRPFPFDALELMKRSEVLRLNAVLSWLGGSATPVSATLEVLTETLSRGDARLDFIGALRHEEGERPLGVTRNTWNAFFLPVGEHVPVMVSLDGQLSKSLAEGLAFGPPEGPFVEEDVEVHAAVSYLALLVADAIKRERGPHFSVEVTPPIDAAIRRFFQRDAPIAEFNWVYSDEAISGFLRVFVPQKLISAVELEEAFFAVRPAGILASLRVPVRGVMAGVSRVPRAEIPQIQVGDLLMPDRHGLADASSLAVERANGGGRVLLRDHEFEACLHADGELWRVEVLDARPQKRLIEEVQMSEESIETTTSLNVSALHAAFVDIDVVVGAAELSVAELGHLKRGSVIELDRRVGDLVDIEINGEVIGRGELVNVEGRIGVRISALAQARAR